MVRALFALLCGALFGAGLLVSGMTDTVKVQGWLDFFGAWDPTLAFVMGGAILPMAVAWRYAGTRKTAFLGTQIPPRHSPEITRDLVAGSVLFGAGWALSGFCPGPAMASLGFGGSGSVVFLLAMLAGMLAMPPLRRTLFATSATSPRTSKMDIRALTPTYAVSPQIDPADLPAIKTAGYTTVIDNRPDAEVPPDLHGETMRRAAVALGLTFVANPVIGGALTEANVTAQRAAMTASTGPVFAYCASGNRSSIVWALSQAGTRSADELIAIPARFGYNLGHLRDQLAARRAKA